MTNREFSEKNKNFREACEKVGLQPTIRQASKYRRRKGKVYKNFRRRQEA